MDNQDLELIGIDLSHMLADPDPTGTRPRRGMQSRNDPLFSESLDNWLLEAAQPAIETRAPLVLEHVIRNTDRTFGARLSGEIARRYGNEGLPPRTIVVRLFGSAGQSFGAFCINGLHLMLSGEANDYVGKGMGGGEIVIRPPLTARWATQENFIMGNTVLYGATGGTLLAAGRAGERFAVRNSGAVAVVEGVGDHGCEYMTGGVVVVLGTTGRNFGAGMTGGMAFVYDHENKLDVRLNKEFLEMSRLADEIDDARVRELIARHVEATESAWVRDILKNWATSRAQFWKIAPRGSGQ